MAYRIDPDLEILSKASNEDLRLLADSLMYSVDKHGKRSKFRRLAATLHRDKKYATCYPNKLHNMWKEIAEELQKFGGHSGVNWIFRLNKGVTYREILIDVCKLQKVKNVDFKKDSTSTIENAFLEKVVILAIERMSESEKIELINGLKNIEGWSDLFKNAVVNEAMLVDLIKIAFKQGGFKSYVLVLQVVNGISKAIVGKGLTFGANAALMKYLGSFMSGPWGWAFAAVTTAWSFMGPNKDATLKGVAIVAYIRKKNKLGL